MKKRANDGIIMKDISLVPEKRIIITTINKLAK